jgi:hypothetical protein
MSYEKYILSLSLELVKVSGYGFPHPCEGLPNSHLFFNRPLVNTDFNIPDLQQSGVAGQVRGSGSGLFP